MPHWTASAKRAAGPAPDGRHAMLSGLGLNKGGASSMGANSWGESPPLALSECRLGLIVSKDNHEPKARAMLRGMVWRNLECERCEDTDCKPHGQGRAMLLAMANASKAFGYAACGQCGASGEGVGSPAQRVLQGVSMEHRLRKLGRVCDNCLRGWTAYHGISQYDSPVPELDDWIRRRVRMLLSETVALGTHEGSALGGFGRGPEDGNPACCQQQKLLAHAKIPGGAAGTVQRVVESARLGQR